MSPNYLLFVQTLLKKNGGKIINIGSIHSRASFVELSAYAATKGAIDSLTVQAALELAPYKINVNTIAPGLVEVEKLVDDPNFIREAHDQQIAWGRVGIPEDIGKTVVFMASNDSDYITGQVLYVDGGLLAKLPIEMRRALKTESWLLNLRVNDTWGLS